MKFYTDIYGSQRDQQVSWFHGPSLYAGGCRRGGVKTVYVVYF